MNLYRLTIVSFATFVVGCNGYIGFEITEPEDAALAAKVSLVNETLHSIFEKPFLVKTVQAFASMDPTVRDFIASINNISNPAFSNCFHAVFYRQGYTTINRKISASFMQEQLINYCPNFKAEINGIKKAVISIKKRLDNSTPEVFAQLPRSVYHILTTAANFSSICLDDLHIRYNATFQETVIKDMATQVNNLNTTDRDALAKLVPWLAPLLQITINTTNMATTLTTLALPVVAEMPAIVTWAYDKIDTLPVRISVQMDSEITEGANRLSEVTNTYGLKALDSSDLIKTITVLIAGRFQFSDKVPTDTFSNYSVKVDSGGCHIISHN